MTPPSMPRAENPRAAGDWIYWFYLFGAVVFEVAGTCVMKYSQSSALIGPTVGYIAMLALIGLSYYLLSLSTRGLAVGVAFAFWEALGLTLITLASVSLLNEPLTLTRIGALVAVLSGAMLVHHGTANTHDDQQGDAPAPCAVPASVAVHSREGGRS